MKGRRWKDQEDALLKKVVLDSIRNGQTQLAAFAEVGNKIGRTAGACGFRWNAVLRQEDPESYREAKRHRVYNKLKEKRAVSVHSLAQTIQALRQIEKCREDLVQEVEHLQQKLKKSQSKQQRLQQEQQNIEHDHRSFADYQLEVKERYRDLLQLFAYLDQQVLNPDERKTGVDTDIE
ncbi:transcription factor, RsfA family [Seinonella peptonophila]|uniref:Transcription factor, RsfA family n=1 Tax=Seinonella peptonophila TaxID=112248 RepID=A0A1M4VNL9_9BACL|nr:hypothetical protein [Seinonella peptonophila]SHE70626.1 transcription factor, RsfA family [Seinonella peptonophila]